MKTLKGKVTSTSPISLSEAARVLSNFISNDPNAAAAATQAVSAYLRRSTAAFDELVQHHKDLGDLQKLERIKDDKVVRIEDGERESKKRRKREDEEETHGGEITGPKKQKKRKRIQPEQY